MGTFGTRFTTAALPLLLLSASLARGGDWHAGTELACSDCHTMHNSQAGAPMRYDRDAQPAPHLLRNATSLSLCLYCHDGSLPGSPDVVAPVAYLSDPAGGFFPADWSTASGTAHVLASQEPVTPPGGSQAMTLTCISCHAPHGSPSYRNLSGDPTGSGSTLLTVTTSQRVKANGTNADKVYLVSNLKDKAGISAWCATCHGSFHGRSVEQEGTASPWLRHPQDQTLASSPHVDYTYWLSTTVSRVRVQTPTDDDVPSADDQVFCLSCHKAHGSQHRAALIFADGARLGSTCEQCHNK